MIWLCLYALLVLGMCRFLSFNNLEGDRGPSNPEEP